MRHNKAYYDNCKEKADALRLLMREVEYATKYGSDEDVADVTRQANQLRDELRGFRRELECYVPDDCPAQLRRRYIQEQAFIKYYYLMGFTMEKTAELMNISRDTVYRIRTRICSA